MDLRATTALLRANKSLLAKQIVGSAFAKSILAYLLAGASRTQQRMARGNLAEDPSPLCPHCGQAEETMRHIIWYCPRWAPMREMLWEVFNIAGLQQLPPCSAHCGVIHEDPELMQWRREFINMEPPAERKFWPVPKDDGLRASQSGHTMRMPVAMTPMKPRPR